MKRATNTNPISADPPGPPLPLFPLAGYHATKTTNCTVRNLHAQYGLKLNWQRCILPEWIHSSVKCGWLWWVVFKTGGNWCWERIVWKGMSDFAFVLRYQAVKTGWHFCVFSNRLQSWLAPLLAVKTAHPILLNCISTNSQLTPTILN